MTDTTDTTTTPVAPLRVSVDVPHLQALADAIMNAAATYTREALGIAVGGLSNVMKAMDERITTLEAELFRLKSGD